MPAHKKDQLLCCGRNVQARNGETSSYIELPGWLTGCLGFLQLERSTDALALRRLASFCRPPASQVGGVTQV